VFSTRGSEPSPTASCSQFLGEFEVFDSSQHGVYGATPSRVVICVCVWESGAPYPPVTRRGVGRVLDGRVGVLTDREL